MTSNFESAALGWRFWEAFRDLKTRAADAAGDVLFSGENDLVVDTASMTRIGVGAWLQDAGRRLDFGSNGEVHHLNYFSQPRAAGFIRQAFSF